MQDAIKEITRKLIDEGRLVEAGWVGLRHMAIPLDASPWQVENMRMAFFAGAQHLFGSIMSVLEPGEEATLNDLNRMTLISKELDEFVAKVKRAATTRVQ
jgi:hypothetical protein